jgi:hypothetical protein
MPIAAICENCSCPFVYGHTVELGIGSGQPTAWSTKQEEHGVGKGESACKIHKNGSGTSSSCAYESSALDLILSRRILYIELVKVLQQFVHVNLRNLLVFRIFCSRHTHRIMLHPIRLVL